MTFALTKLLSLLVYPLSHAILLCLLALLLRFFNRGGTWLLAVAVAWLWLCSTSWFADITMASLESGQSPKAISAVPEAGAIVVLGGSTRGDVHLGSLGDLNAQADRLVKAAVLYQAGKAPFVLASGGAAADARPEAELMQELLEVMGVPARQVLTESVSRDTRENAQFSRQLLQQRGGASDGAELGAVARRDMRTFADAAPLSSVQAGPPDAPSHRLPV